MRLAHGYLETAEIHLAQRPLVDVGRSGVAVRLLVVGREMLAAGKAAWDRLDALGYGRGHLAGDEGVFRVVLEVPAAERMPDDVQRRGKPVRHAVGVHLASNRLADTVHEVDVPGLGNARRCGESRYKLVDDLVFVGIAVQEAGHCAGEHLVQGQRRVERLDGSLRIDRRPALQADARRPVTELDIGNARIDERRRGMADCPGDAEALFSAEEARAYAEVDLLLVEERADEGFEFGQGTSSAFIRMRLRDDAFRVDGKLGKVFDRRGDAAWGGQLCDRTGRSAEVAVPLEHDALPDGDGGCRGDIRRGRAQAEEVRAAFEHGLGRRLVVRGQIAQRKRELDLARCAWL